METNKIITIPPTPWEAKTFMVVDANGRSVLHVGGNGFLESDTAVAVVEYLVKCVNAAPSPPIKLICAACERGEDFMKAKDNSILGPGQFVHMPSGNVCVIRLSPELRDTTMMIEAIKLCPIPLLLSCRSCGAPHVDEGEWATKKHRTHLCKSCKHTWEPFRFYTVGVSPEHLMITMFDWAVRVATVAGKVGQ